MTRAKGGRLYVRMSPKTSTMGGMTKGRSANTSIRARARGARKWTQSAVGMMSARPTTIVITAISTEKVNVRRNRGSLKTWAHARKLSTPLRARSEKRNVATGE